MKKILVLCFFPAFVPPVSGGELRLFNMYKRLSERFDVSLVSWTYPQSRFEVVQHGLNFREYRVPKDASFDEAYDSCHKAGITGELAGVVCAMVGRGDTQYHKVVSDLVTTVDAIIHEFPYTLLYDRSLWSDGKPRFYNSHNLESEMVGSLAQGARAAEVFDFVSQLERSLVAKSRLVFATSPEELLKFRLFYGASSDKLRLAPNGFSPEDVNFERQELEGQDGYGLFVGSQHPPNVEGARFLVETLAPRFPRQRFVIAGRVCHSIGWAPGNVQLLGEVTTEEKSKLLQQASFFVNPIFAGAGTSLKMVEAMAAGLPIVTTRAGARGLGLQDNVDALFAERENFDSVVLRLAHDPDLRQRLSAAARRAAFARFSWPAIGRSVAHEIEQAIGSPEVVGAERRLTLVVNDYSVRNAVSGGSKRIFNLLREVATTRDVALLCLHDKPVLEVEELAPGLTEIRVPKSDEQRAFESWVNERNWMLSINDIAASLFCLGNDVLKRLFRRIGDNAGTVVFSHPFMAPLLEAVGMHQPVVYEAHNVEAQMKADILKPHADGEILSAFVGTLEDYLCERADALICVTDADRNALVRQRSKTPSHVVPNGCEVLSETAAKEAITERARRDVSGGFRAVFVGSAHPPNIDAARFLCSEVLPHFPDMQLWVIGSVGESLDGFAHLPGLRRFGVVSDQLKHDLLLQADLALNPMAGGGGSNLKIAEYLGYALPTISTETGVRGFAVEDGVHVLVRPQERFAEAIEDLLADRNIRTALAAAGHDFASANLDWCQLGRRYGEVLNQLTSPRPAGRPLRMLVVTYRYTEPCQGGAEEYLVRVLQRYVELYGASVDLVAPDVGRITNLYHFASAYQPTQAKAERLFAPFLNRVKLFPAEPLDGGAMRGASERLWLMWMAERRALGRQAAEQMTATCLLGGWYDAELHDSAFQRWSSEHAEIHAAKGVSGLRVVGWHPGSVEIEVQIEGDEPTRFAVRNDFSFELSLPPETSNRISLRVPARPAGDHDPRHLGILLKKLEILQGHRGVWKTVGLEQGFDAVWRHADPAGWIEALRAVALARTVTDEEVFRAVRGPRSPELVKHVRQVATQYDVVLLQGVPFSITPDVMQAVRGSGVPTIILPHYHVDDAFYHWKQYYEAFAEADAVLSFSSWVSEKFFSKLGVTAPVIAGGGIEPAEYASRGGQLEEFRAFRGSDRPYFLVLGRKTGSKGYRTIIEAHQELLRTTSLDVDLVLIGPDEDKQPVEDRNVHFYGRLSRELMLGALAGCTALVTMSTSESFGIVIVESWMSGKPVIANHQCLSFQELIDDGKDGLLVRNVSELIDAMKFFLSDHEASAIMGRMGHQKAARQYTWTATAQRLDEIIVNISQSSRADCTVERFS